MNELHEVLMRLLKPATFVFWGLTLLTSAFMASEQALSTDSFVLRHLFALTLVSWCSGIVLVVRVVLRRGRHERGMFG
jgi:hypothetical protein